MDTRRRNLVVGLATIGLAGVLAGGFGLAQAATATNAPASATGWGGYGHPMMQAGQQPCLTAAASYLGLSVADLQTQLRTGKSLADVAAARGRSVDGLREAMLSAARTALQADQSLTAEQRSTLLAQMTSRIDAMIHNAGGSGAGWGGHGMMGGGMMGRMHR